MTIKTKQESILEEQGLPSVSKARCTYCWDRALPERDLRPGFYWARCSPSRVNLGSRAWRGRSWAAESTQLPQTSTKTANKKGCMGFAPLGQWDAGTGLQGQGKLSFPNGFSWAKHSSPCQREGGIAHKWRLSEHSHFRARCGQQCRSRVRRRGRQGGEGQPPGTHCEVQLWWENTGQLRAGSPQATSI